METANSTYEALVDVLGMNDHATREMSSRRYTVAIETLALALQRAKDDIGGATNSHPPEQLVVQDINREGGAQLPPSSHTQAPPLPMGVCVEFGIAWRLEERRSPPDVLPPHAVGVFRYPVTFHLRQQELHDGNGPPRNNTGDLIFRRLCFGLMVNMAMCYHMQAILYQLGRPDGVRLSRQASQLYQLAGTMLYDPAVAMLLQEGHLAGTPPPRRSPLELILLNNMGEVFLLRAEETHLEALICFQYLSVTVANFKSTTSTNQNDRQRSRNDDMEALVNYFHSQVMVSRHLPFIFDLVASAA